jgi:hypothetical protein
MTVKFKTSFLLLCVLFVIFCPLPLKAEIEFWKLDQLNVKKLKKIKHRHSTIVWESSHNVYEYEEFYIKIWEPDARRSKNFLKAYKVGVFEDIAALKAIILDRSQACRGYVTVKTRKLHPWMQLPGHVQKAQTDLEHTDSTAFVELLQRMRQKTLDTGFVYGDIRYDNVGMLKEACYLFDLDGIVSLRIYKNLKKRYLWHLFPDFYISETELNEMTQPK